MTMAGLRFVSAEVGVQFVMTSGRIRMLALHVDSLVSLNMVRNSHSIIIAQLCSKAELGRFIMRLHILLG